MSARAKWLRRLAPWWLAFVGGGLLILCFPPFHAGGLVWVALSLVAAGVWLPATEVPTAQASVTPWWRHFWRRGHSFALGYGAGLIFFSGTFYWIGALGVLFQFPLLRGIPLLLGAYLAIYVGGWTAGLRLLCPRAYRFDSSWRNLALAAAGGAWWVALEWVRGWLFTGFGWNNLAVAARDQLGLIQILDLTGSAGLSWLIVFVNLMLVIMVRRIAGEFGPNLLRRVRWEFSAAMAVVAIAFAYGVYRQPRVDRPGGMQLTFKVAMLQPNVPEEIKFAGKDREDEVFQIVGALHAEVAKQEPLLEIWPEATTPRGIFADSENLNFLRRIVATGNFNLLMGSLEFDLLPEHPDETRTFNSAMLFAPGGREWQTSRKMHLVPFGEFMPFRAVMPDVINELVPGDIASGREFNVLQLPFPPVPLGALICFEDSLPTLARGYVQKGAQLLVNLTNDAWFLRTPGVEAHLANAQLRAVETRRPLLRCANTGVTCMVDPLGRVERWLPTFQRGFAVREISVNAERPVTFYTQYGDWFAQLALLLSGAALLRAGLRGRARSAQ